MNSRLHVSVLCYLSSSGIHHALIRTVGPLVDKLNIAGHFIEKVEFSQTFSTFHKGPDWTFWWAVSGLMCDTPALHLVIP